MIEEMVAKSWIGSGTDENRTLTEKDWNMKVDGSCEQGKLVFMAREILSFMA